MNPAVVEHEGQEDITAQVVTTMTSPGVPSAARHPALPTPHGTCVNCGRVVTLQRVASDTKRHTFQWVPDNEAARPGRWCSEAALPAYHWADSATAAVYHVPA
ncbi:hypothetical protein [Promicromonospora sp. NPDC023805]|uniref:hypothetical protein n=1 Tax=Promicromonospora sp. NPDC023805 TaxID=3154696 RepID=UPI0033F85D9F